MLTDTPQSLLGVRLPGVLLLSGLLAANCSVVLALASGVTWWMLACWPLVSTCVLMEGRLPSELQELAVVSWELLLDSLCCSCDKALVLLLLLLLDLFVLQNTNQQQPTRFRLVTAKQRQKLPVAGPGFVRPCGPQRMFTWSR